MVPEKRKKNEGISCLKSLNVLCRGLRRHIRRLSIKKMPNYNIFTSFVIINPGLLLDPDWIRSQQQAGSGSGFSKIPGFGFSEYETLLLTIYPDLLTIYV
jgi:hypothetical protein